MPPSVDIWIKCRQIPPPLIKLKVLSVLPLGWDAEVKVGDLPVEEVEGVCPGPAVEFGFDSLGMCVRSELLPRLLGD